MTHAFAVGCSKVLRTRALATAVAAKRRSGQNARNQSERMGDSYCMKEKGNRHVRKGRIRMLGQRGYGEVEPLCLSRVSKQ